MATKKKKKAADKPERKKINRFEREKKFAGRSYMTVRQRAVLMERTNEVMFDSLWSRMGGNMDEVNEEYEELFSRYEADGRHYHNFHHLNFMLDRNDLWCLSSYRSYHVEAAIWWHDAIYVPGSTDNEELSAQLFLDALSRCNPLPGSNWEWAADMIRATKDHIVPDLHDEFWQKDTALFLDLDLGGLAAKWPIYYENAINVRTEYANVSDAEWKSGRISFLETYLARPKIYQAPLFAYREQDARDNMTKELEQLKTVGCILP